MKNKPVISLILLLVFLSGVVGVNLYVDEAAIFRTGKLNRQLALLSDEGLNAVGIDNYNGRSFLRYYIPQHTQGFESIVLGSSRGIQFSGEMLGSESFYNSCVTGAEIEDIVSIYEMYHVNNIAPKTVLIAFDSWFLNAAKQDGRWAGVYPDFYKSFCEESGIDSKAPSRLAKQLENLTTLVSPSYFQSSLKNFGKRLAQGKFTIDSISGDDTVEGIVRSDGSYRYPYEYMNAPTDAVQERVNNAMGSLCGELIDFNGIDERKALLLTKLLDMIESDGGQVIVFIPPYSTLAYSMMQEQGLTGALDEIEQYVRAVCDERGIYVCGSFDPNTSGYTQDDFYDSLHLNNENTALVAKAIADDNNF